MEQTALPASVDANKTVENKTVENKVESTQNEVVDTTWTAEKAEAIKSKYKNNPDEIAKALHSQQGENAKTRKEMESLKKELESFKSKVSAENKTEPKVEDNKQTKEEITFQQPSLYERALQDYFDNEKISDELANEIKKANNFSNDKEYQDYISTVKIQFDSKIKEIQQFVKTPVRDLFKNGPSVLSDDEIVAMQIGVKAGVYDVLKHVERKLLAANKEPSTVKHGSVGNTHDSKGFESMEEYYKAANSPNRGIASYEAEFNAKNSNTNWAKLRENIQIGSFRPKI